MADPVHEQEPFVQEQGDCHHPLRQLDFDDITGGLHCRACKALWYPSGTNSRMPLMKLLLLKLKERMDS